MEPIQNRRHKPTRQVQRRGARAVLWVITTEKLLDVSPTWFSFWTGNHCKYDVGNIAFWSGTMQSMTPIPESDSIINKSDNRTRGANRLRQIYIKTELYKQSFFPRTIQIWNQLQTMVTNSTTLDDLKASLKAAAALRTTTKTMFWCR